MITCFLPPSLMVNYFVSTLIELIVVLSLMVLILVLSLMGAILVLSLMVLDFCSQSVGAVC